MKTPVTIGLTLLLGSVAGCATATGPDGSKRYGFELPDMLELSLYVTLGGSYRRVGDLREARPYFEEGLALRAHGGAEMTATPRRELK